ncbi:hypothetical protein RC62_1293 [Flavobacterium aquidurense]|uniref:Uncharacterized protein n=1 Tax=Flavobacterium aquidurense TaxID=362413 RepID=A0A0Q0RSG2_9FLAO|nr:hypothetical protein RC62_1293 [Flavobacterium aquidurense]
MIISKMYPYFLCHDFLWNLKSKFMKKISYKVVLNSIS